MSTRALFWILVMLFSPSALAGQWLQKCEQANKESQQKCKQAYDSYKASDAARKSSGVASSTNDTHNNAINLKGKIEAAKAELDKDIAQCEAAQKSCEGECDKQKGLAQPEASKQPPNQDAISDIGQIPGKKSSDCTGEIQPKTQEMKAGRAPLDSQSQESQNTKDQSQAGGGMPQMSPPKSDDKGSDTGSTGAGTVSAAAAAAGLNCAVAGGSRFSDCNATFVAKCTASMGASECDAFSDRYCNLTSSSGQPPMAAATTNLVIDKRSEGLGSSFCSLANAHRYCQTPGRETCPSCIKVYAQASCQSLACIGQTSTSLNSGKQPGCLDDPSYLTPVNGAMASPEVKAIGQLSGGGTGIANGSAASQLVNSGSSSAYLAPASLGSLGAGGGGAGGSGSTGGGAVGSGAAGGGGGAAGGAASNREDSAGSIIGSMDVGGAGGGGGGGGSGDSPYIANEERILGALDVKAAFDGLKREPAAAAVGVAADVSNAYGPSIFSIGSGAIHGFCVRGRIPSCN